MKVQFAPSARAQFLSALSYIRKDKPSAAVSFRNRAEKILRRLEDFPESGRIIPEFPDLPYREVIVSPYRFFLNAKTMLFGLLQCGMGHSFQRNQNFNANHSLVGTGKSRRFFQGLGCRYFRTFMISFGVYVSRPHSSTVRHQ